MSRNRSRTEALTPETVQAIRTRNQLDMEVYHYAREHLAKELEKEGLSMRAEYWYYRGIKKAVSIEATTSVRPALQKGDATEAVSKMPVTC